MEHRELEERVREGFRSIEDPELGLSIIDLGLVRDIQVSEEYVQVLMTLTTPACPYGPELIEATRRSATETTGGGREVVIQLVWEPPWDPMKEASEDALAALGVWR